MSSLQQQKRLVEQLRIECTVTRVPMSQSIKDLMSYMEAGKNTDPFIVGIDKKTNPFNEKTSCAIL